MKRLLLRPAARLQKSQPGVAGKFGWTCASCQRHAVLRRSGARSYATNPTTSSSLSRATSPDTKPYYVTTPIFYVNAAPHIGHLYSMVLADAVKRWHALSGRKALLLTGTDEHGMKIQRAAAANETPPQQWCDMQSKNFRGLADKALVSYDHFIRTTDSDHKDAVRHFWYLLKNSGYIYESKHEGWYCVSDETFYTESQLAKKQDFVTGRVYLASIETGNEVEWTEEKTYHFRMTALKDRLLEFYKQNPEWITPAFRMQEVVDWVTNKLEDLSISRPTSRLEWGVRVPDDESHTIYVWVDALVNYLTKAGFPNWAPGMETKGGWPADLHVIGKDILRFHGVYWPALLLAVGITPPKRIVSHAHWTMGGQKMSKSLGNVVNPFHALDRWGVGLLRYFLLSDGGIGSDANYDNAMIVQRYKKDLQGGIGNLLSRVTRTRRWNVRECVDFACFSLAYQTVTCSSLDFKAANKRVKELHRAMTAEMEKGNARKAIRILQTYVSEANTLIFNLAPWQIAQHLLREMMSEDEIREKREKLLLSIFYMAEMLRHIGIWLQPFIPGKGKHLLEVLGVEKSKRSFEYIGIGRDHTYGAPIKDPGRSSHDSMFPNLDQED